MFFVNRPGAHNQLSMFCASSKRETHRNSKELHNQHMYQDFISRHFSNQSGIIVVVVNWPLRRVIWSRILRGRHHGTRL